MSFRGTHVLITGASRGLGRALAEELGRRGARLGLVARGTEDLEQLAAALRAQGVTAHAFPADLGDPAAAARLVGEVGAVLGPVEVLIHAASTLGDVPLRLLLDTRDETFREVLEVNLLGPFRLTRALVGGMVLRGRGLVVGVSSDAAENAYPTWGPYGVSKRALDHLMGTFAAELEGTGVHFSSLDPGEMDTRMHADAVPDADPTTLRRPEAVAAAMATLLEAPGFPSGARVGVEVAP